MAKAVVKMGLKRTNGVVSYTQEIPLNSTSAVVNWIKEEVEKVKEEIKLTKSKTIVAELKKQKSFWLKGVRYVKIYKITPDEVADYFKDTTVRTKKDFVNDLLNGFYLYKKHTLIYGRGVRYYSEKELKEMGVEQNKKDPFMKSKNKRG